MVEPKRVNPTRHLYQGHLYMPASHTDIRIRFEAIREQMRKPAENVKPMRRQK
jgi:hypothetical protein